MRASTFQFQRRRSAAFTLVEVILAIVIALGILVVLLYFYQQATNFRTQAIQETERLAAARLVMDRLSSELGTLRIQRGPGQGFVGGSNSIHFVKAAVPSFSSWMGGALRRSAAPVSDLQSIEYRLDSADGTNITGLLRTETALVLRPDATSLDDADETNTVATADAPLVLEEIRFLQFRYWSGTNWIDGWNQAGAPKGVEVTLGAEPITNGTDLADYSADLFRRVIYISGNASADERPFGTLGAAGGGEQEAP